MKVIVTGGRDYMDWWTVYNILDCFPITCIVQGGASGADTIAVQYARDRGIPFITVEAKWKIYGRRAGQLRNQEMLRAHPDGTVVAFPGGSGTSGCVAFAKHLGLPIYRVA